MTIDLAALAPLGLPAGFLLVVLSVASRENRLARTLVIGLSLVFMWRYLWWRITQTLPDPALTPSFVFAVVFVSVELLVGIGSTMTWIVLSRTLSRSKQADEGLAWVKQNAPAVDILVCTFNEDREILERTINGTKALRYPNFRIWLLDDGRRPWVGELCREKGCEYLTRPDNSHAKAGNINHALAYIATQSVRPDFVAILDADFVPFPDFLTRTLALCSDDRTGLVQTPQHFFNPDPIQSNLAITKVFPDEQRFFFETLMPSKDAWGQAFCCGTSCVIRFSALQEIGFFPTGSVTEDFLLSARLYQHGYKSVFLNERLSVGLAPEGLREYTVQRARWCLGAMQIVRGKDGPFNFSNRLPFAFRLGLIETAIFWSALFPFRVLCQLATPAYLVFGLNIFQASTADSVSHFAPMLLTQFVTAIWVSEGRMLPIMTDVQQLLIAPEVMRAVASAMFSTKEKKFKVTAKGITSNKATFHWGLISRYALMILANAAGVATLLLTSDTDWVTTGVVGTLFWTWYNLIVLILCCLVCVEQPRHRQHERYEVREKAFVQSEHREQYFFSRDVSVGGMSFDGPLPDSVGSGVRVRFCGSALTGVICRGDKSSFAIMFTDDKSREDMTAYIYNETVCKATAQTQMGKLVAKLVNRAAA